MQASLSARIRLMDEGNPIMRFALFTLLFLVGNAFSQEKHSVLPDQEGFAGPFAGVSHGVVLVGGGANFPDKKPWEGGKKVWYDTVFALQPEGEWKVVGQLPRPLGYGICVTHRDTVVCVGGSDAQNHYAKSFLLNWKDGKLVTSSLPPLPKPLANGSGALVGNVLYVAGGQERPDSKTASRSVYRLDLAASKPKWEEIEPLPGVGRIFPVAASFEGAFWVISGAELIEGKDKTVVRRYLKDSYRFDPDSGWKRIADLPAAVVAAPSPAPSDERGFYLLGGDNGKQVVTPPNEHRGFSDTLLRYDSKNDLWIEERKLPFARVTVPVVPWKDGWLIPSGEVRPGVRSPEVWRFTLRGGKE